MSEPLIDRLRADLNSARRERDRQRTNLLSMTLAEAKNRQIELKRELTDAETQEVVGRAIKRRREAAEQMNAAGRTELAEQEEQEAALLTGYLPAQISEEEARAVIRAAIAAGADSVGTVMAAVMPQLKGRFDGRETNRLVREELG